MIQIQKEEKLKLRRKAWMLLFLMLIAMLIPIRFDNIDSGTVEFQAMLYKVTKWNTPAIENQRAGIKTGTTVKILYWEVYDDSHFETDSIDMVLSPAS